MQLVISAILTFLSTLGGGLFAIRFRDKLNLILSFSAGVILGVIAFDIMPEIFDLNQKLGVKPLLPMTALVAGFLVFHILEKSLLIHHNHEKDYAEHTHPEVGQLSAWALIGHSLMDGISIGLGFQVSLITGILITVAVISHDFVDGLNTVSLMLHNRNSIKKSIRFLILDALAPLVGVLVTKFFTLPDKFLLLYIGFFAGFLLYIGASDILPEAHSKKSSSPQIILTVLGAAIIYLVTRLINVF